MKQEYVYNDGKMIRCTFRETTRHIPAPLGLTVWTVFGDMEEPEGPFTVLMFVAVDREVAVAVEPSEHRVTNGKGKFTTSTTFSAPNAFDEASSWNNSSDSLDLTPIHVLLQVDQGCKYWKLDEEAFWTKEAAQKHLADLHKKRSTEKESTTRST